MGYTSQVRYATTKKGFEKIKELAPKRYKELLDEKIKNGGIVESAHCGENEIAIKDEYMPGHFVTTLYYKEFDTDFPLYTLSRDGKYVLFGMDWVKWFGYDHIEKQALEWACDKCGEIVHCVMVGEDGEHDEEWWNNDEEDYNMPYIGVTTCIDDGEWR